MDKDYPELLHHEWILDLASLVDMCHLGTLNLVLQGKLKMLPDLVKSISAYVNKLLTYANKPNFCCVMCDIYIKSG